MKSYHFKNKFVQKYFKTSFYAISYHALLLFGLECSSVKSKLPYFH